MIFKKNSRGWTLIFFTRIYILAIFIFVFTYEIQCFSFIFLFFSYLFNFMHNINIIHRSFFPTALPHRLPFLFIALPFLVLPVSLPCLILCTTYFLDLLMPTSFCLYAFFLCLLPICRLPFLFLALPCMFPCPAYFLCLLPVSLPCLILCPAYFRALPIGLLFLWVHVARVYS